MSLSLIWGPPNAGRVGETLTRFRSSLREDPVLVVPTADDAELFEQELAAGGALLGGSVSTFGGLVGEVARALDLPWGAGLTRPQSVWLARLASRRAGLDVLAPSAARRGFAPALAELIDELQTGGIGAATLTELTAQAGGHEREIALLFAEREALRAQLGLADRHELARAATAGVREAPDGWSRPVFVYGFDELTVEQLDLVGALAAATEVTVAVTYEDRASLAARAKLLGDLRGLVPPDLLGGETRLDADPKTTEQATLWHIERGFLEPGAGRIAPGEGLSLLRSSGERAEAELVGAEVAKLLAAGTEPEQIAIVLRSPARSGALWMEVLGRLGIPVAVEASAPLTATATGRGLLAVARLAGTGATAEDLIAFLRTPGRAPSGQVDRLERTIRREGLRSAAEAERAWGAIGKARELFELSDLREAGSGASLLNAAAKLARMVAEYPIEGLAEIPGPKRALELKAAAEVERALKEVARLDPAEAGPAELEEIVAEVRVRLHQGGVRGRVRVVSPYRLRARRVQHLFAASLQDTEFPRRDPGSPLLGDDQRAELGLPERAPADEEERYLFAVCLSRPERGLALSWRYADDDGRAVARSPFIDDVRDLLEPEQPEDPEASDPLFKMLGRERGPADVVPSPAEASSPHELARSVAVAGRESWRRRLQRLALTDGAAATAAGELAAATETTEPMRMAPRDLRSPAVLEALGGRELFGASTLEEYETCSYRWFVGHELKPQRLEPADEPLVLGGLAHQALEELYRERPGGTPRPVHDNLAQWRERARELVEKHAADSDLPSSDPVALAQIRRVEGLVSAHLADEAAAARVLEPDPELLEAAFGEEAQRPALGLDGLRLHGSIDRVDVVETPAGKVGLITDYKLSREVIAASKLAEEGKLQLQLYSLALRELWGIEPLGGVYLPLRGTDNRRPRGVMNDEYADQLEGLRTYPNDRLDPDEFEATLDAAAATASRIAADVHRGRLRRDPLGGECPRYCRFQTICRRERGMAEDDDPPEEQDER